MKVVQATHHQDHIRYGISRVTQLYPLCQSVGHYSSLKAYGTTLI